MLALVEAVAANVKKGTRIFRFHKITRRIATRFGPETARVWLQAAFGFQGSIDLALLRAAIASGNFDAIEAVIGSSKFGQALQALEAPFAQVSRTTGTASAGAMNEAGIAATFNAVHPNVVLFARDQSAVLVQAIPSDVREGIRTVLAIGQQQGLTIIQQARAIREIVPLPPPWQNAPLSFAEEIRTGQIAKATGRRISAVDKAQIRSRINTNRVTESFIADMQEKYSKSLVSRRAATIARTENLRAANAGQHESWTQATQEGVLPADSRRFWLVTPDERLSPEHAQIPSMNPEGRGMNEEFDTPDGFFMYPPSRPNCRCGIGLGIGTGK